MRLKIKTQSGRVLSDASVQGEKPQVGVNVPKRDRGGQMDRIQSPDRPYRESGAGAFCNRRRNAMERPGLRASLQTRSHRQRCSRPQRSGGSESMECPARFDQREIGGHYVFGPLERSPRRVRGRLTEQPGKNGAAFSVENHRSPRTQSSAARIASSDRSPGGAGYRSARLGFPRRTSPARARRPSASSGLSPPTSGGTSRAITTPRRVTASASPSCTRRRYSLSRFLRVFTATVFTGAK